MEVTTTQLSGAQRVILESSKDWRLWVTQLRTYAADEAFWQVYVDPEVEAPALILQEPIAPAVHDYSEEYKRSHRHYVTHRRAAASAGPSPEGPTLQEPHPRDFLLTSPERAAYAQDWERFKTLDLAHYHRDRALFQRVSSYITDTISLFAKGIIRPEHTLRERVQALGRRFGESEVDAQRTARAGYREALAPPKASTRKALDQWLGQWEMAFQKAQEALVPEVAFISSWIEDLCKALEPRVPALKQQWLAGTLQGRYPLGQNITERDVVSAIHREWDLTPSLFIQTGRAQGAALAAISQGTTPRSSVPTGSSEPRSRGRSGTDTTSRLDVDAKRRKRHCIGCLAGGHELKGCFLAFPEHPDRPDDWLARLQGEAPQRRRKVWHALRQDPEVIRVVLDTAKQTGWRHDLADKNTGDITA
jgi:hypothetical protein